MYKPKFLGWLVLSGLKGCQECHAVAPRRALHRQLRRCRRPGWWAQGSYTETVLGVALCSPARFLHPFTPSSQSLLIYLFKTWSFVVKWKSRVQALCGMRLWAGPLQLLACSLQNMVTTRYLLIPSDKQTLDVWLGFLIPFPSGSTTPFN